MLDEQSNRTVVLKRTGHQWYWSYEIPCINIERFDSYILSSNAFNLLEVDSRVFTPYNVNTTIITTSADVLHAFTIPSIGIKIDSVPGRLNSIRTFLSYPGVYYGQCSEICGANHSFIPIVLEAINFKDFFFESKNICNKL